MLRADIYSLDNYVINILNELGFHLGFYYESSPWKTHLLRSSWFYYELEVINLFVRKI